jgi:hypothetical protein
VHLGGLFDDARPDRAPIFYLHGRVGWYVNEEGTLVALTPDAPLQDHLGAPAILLPDPHKDYSLHEFAEVIWEQFRMASHQATKSIVVGHSLHDDALVQVLRSRNPATTAVTLFADSTGSYDRSEVSRIRVLLPGVHVVPMDFGPDLRVHDQSLEAFVSGAAPAIP